MAAVVPLEPRIAPVRLAAPVAADFPVYLIVSELTLIVDGKEKAVKAIGDGPVDAAFNAVNSIILHTARLQLYQVHAVTEGTDAQAIVSVKMEENGKISTGESADTDTVVASTKAYVNALNRLLIRRQKVGLDIADISYKDAS